MLMFLLLGGADVAIGESLFCSCCCGEMRGSVRDDDILAKQDFDLTFVCAVLFFSLAAGGWWPAYSIRICCDRQVIGWKWTLFPVSLSILCFCSLNSLAKFNIFCEELFPANFRNFNVLVSRANQEAPRSQLFNSLNIIGCLHYTVRFLHSSYCTALYDTVSSLAYNNNARLDSTSHHRMRTVDNTNKKRRGYGLSVSEKRSRRRLNRNNRTNNKSNKLVPVSVPVQVQVNIQSKSSRETHTNKPFSSKSKRHREERERDPFEVPSDHEDDNDNEDEDPENDEDCFEMMIPKKQEEVQPTRMNRTRGVSSRSRLLRKRKRIVIDIDSDSDSEESNHNEIEIEIENENREDREDSTRTNHHGDNNDYIDIEEPPVPLTQPFTQREQSTGTGRDRIDTLLLAPGRTTRTRSTISKRRGHVRSDCSFAEVEIDEIVSSDDADSSSSSPAAVLDNARAQLSQRRSSSTRSQSRNTMDNDMDGSSTDDSSVGIQLIGRRQAQNTIATRPRTTRTRTNSQNRTSMDTRRIQDSIQSDVDASSKDVPMSMSADISSSAGGDNDGHDDDDDDSSFEYIASQNKSRKNRATTVRDPKHLDRSKSRTRTGIKKQTITCEDDQSDTTNVNDSGNDNGNAAARIRTRSRAKSMNESNPNTGTSQEEPSSSPNPTDTCSTSTCTNPKIANKIKALSDLSNKVSSLSPSSSKQALDKLVQRIVNQYNELSRFQESLNGDADVDGSRQQDLEKLHQDVVKFSQCIMNAVFRLFTSSSGISIHKEKGRGRGRAMVLINTCIMKFHFKATSVEDLYGIYLKQQSVKEEEGQSESIELLTQDEHLFSNALSMLADIVEQDDSSWNDVEQHVIPLMSFLHTISPKGLVAHVLSVESKGEVGMVVQSIQKLVTSLPNMHSYPWMELTLAFIYKLRFHLLSSIDHVSMKEQEDRIRATRDIYDSLPSTFLEGIESLDPPLSNAILKRLSDEKRCFDYKFTHFHERTFLEWSREYIVDFVCCHSKYLATFTCSGICKYMHTR